MVEYKAGQTKGLMTVLIQALVEVIFLQFDSELMATFVPHVAKHVNTASFLKAVQTIGFEKEGGILQKHIKTYPRPSVLKKNCSVRTNIL